MSEDKQIFKYEDNGSMSDNESLETFLKASRNSEDPFSYTIEASRASAAAILGRVNNHTASQRDQEIYQKWEGQYAACNNECPCDGMSDSTCGMFRDQGPCTSGILDCMYVCDGTAITDDDGSCCQPEDLGFDGKCFSFDTTTTGVCDITVCDPFQKCSDLEMQQSNASFNSTALASVAHICLENGCCDSSDITTTTPSTTTTKCPPREEAWTLNCDTRSCSPTCPGDEGHDAVNSYSSEYVCTEFIQWNCKTTTTVSTTPPTTTTDTNTSWDHRTTTTLEPTTTTPFPGCVAAGCGFYTPCIDEPNPLCVEYNCCFNCSKCSHLCKDLTDNSTAAKACRDAWGSNGYGNCCDPTTAPTTTTLDVCIEFDCETNCGIPHDNFAMTCEHHGCCPTTTTDTNTTPPSTTSTQDVCLVDNCNSNCGTFNEYGERCKENGCCDPTTTGDTTTGDTTTTGEYCCDFCDSNYNPNPNDAEDSSGCSDDGVPAWCPFSGACNFGGPLPTDTCNSGCALSFKFACTCPSGCYYDGGECWMNDTTNTRCTNSC